MNQRRKLHSACYVVRAQAVDETSSGMKLVSKVVFMTHEKRFVLPAVQKSDM